MHVYRTTHDPRMRVTNVPEKHIPENIHSFRTTSPSNSNLESVKQNLNDQPMAPPSELQVRTIIADTYDNPLCTFPVDDSLIIISAKLISASPVFVKTDAHVKSVKNICAETLEIILGRAETEILPHAVFYLLSLINLFHKTYPQI